MARAQSDNFVITTSITRPSDTTAYAAGDQIADSTSAPTVLTFAGAARYPGWGGRITKILILDSANVATPLNCELWLFDTTLTPNNDNAAFAPTDAVVNTVQAVVPIATAYVGNSTSGAGGNLVLAMTDIDRRYVCAAGSQALYGCLVARNGYVPVSGEIFTIRLFLERD